MVFRLITIYPKPQIKRKNNMKKILIIFILFQLFHKNIAQDTAQILSLESVLYMVRTYHPLALQSANLTDQANANLLIAQGQFDPKIAYENTNKFYKGINYYNLSNLNLLVPTRLGADFYIGTQTANGQYVNPDEITPPGGLSGLGLNIPLLRNLITDQRRNQLRKAKILQGQNESTRKQQLNDLCAEVIKDYIDWYISWKETKLYRNALILTTRRLEAIRQEVSAGGKARIDTLETWTQLQNFNISLQESEAKQIKYKLNLSVHLWSANGQPLEPAETATPGQSGWDQLDSLGVAYGKNLATLISVETNPSLQNSKFEIDIAKLDLNWKRQALLPDLDIKYRMLGNNAFYKGFNYSPDNYQFGLKFGTSLFLRKERGDYKMAKLKAQNAEYKYEFKQRELENKNLALWQQRYRNSQIWRNYTAVVEGYSALYNAELQRAEAGESNIFLVNTRELRLIESRLKHIQYERKMIESNIDFLQNAAVLFPFIEQ
jgi:outer membrane protein TolC